MDSDQVTYSPETPEWRWWQGLDDELLMALIVRAAESNHDVAIAHARVREARSAIGIAEAQLLPQAGVRGNYRRFRFSENTPVLDDFIQRGLVDRDQELYEVGFDAAWEVDIFGGGQRAVEAAEARAQATTVRRRAVLLSVVAEVARNYFEARGSQASLDALERNIELQRESLRLTQHRLDTGLGTELEVAQAQAQLDATRARRPTLRAAELAASYRLAVLTDQRSSDILTRLSRAKPVPAAPDVVPVGLPGDLLRRRPDVQAAERSLHAATADVGVAVSDLYPSFFLTGSPSLQASSFTSLFDAGSAAWSIGPSIRWPIFQGGQIRAHIDVTQARQEAALLRYRKVVLEAVADAETTLTRYAKTYQHHQRLAQAMRSQQEALELARDAYQSGLVTLLDVVDAQRQLTKTQIELAQVRARVLVALASLNKALGGGWDPAAWQRTGPGEKQTAD